MTASERLICPGCYEPITTMVGTTSSIAEGVEGYVVYHSECDPLHKQINKRAV